MKTGPNTDEGFMRLALKLARRALGDTSPNPLVGAVMVKAGNIIGQGWHHRAGQPHAEIEALRDAERRGNNPAGATLFVTLEPCCTQGRTPPCTSAIIAAGISRVIVGATDPNPAHAGRAFPLLRKAGIGVKDGVLDDDCTRLNEGFNHWIIHRTPFVIVKAAMTLDGKIATADGESKWITGEKARAFSMKLRQSVDAILVGINTVIADDPSLDVRLSARQSPLPRRRIILDSRARTPLSSRVVIDEFASSTTIVTLPSAPAKRVEALAKRVNVWPAPVSNGTIDLSALLAKLGSENVTSLLVEGGGEVNASFLFGGWAHRAVFFYAPKILGGRNSRKGVAGEGATRLENMIHLQNIEWKRAGVDLMMTGRLK